VSWGDSLGAVVSCSCEAVYLLQIALVPSRLRGAVQGSQRHGWVTQCSAITGAVIFIVCRPCSSSVIYRRPAYRAESRVQRRGRSDPKLRLGIEDRTPAAHSPGARRGVPVSTKRSQETDGMAYAVGRAAGLKAALLRLSLHFQVQACSMITNHADVAASVL
jgi:hypothetical protein